MLIVPTQAVPNQTLQCQLSNQALVVGLRQMLYGLFADVSIGADVVCQGVICLNRTRIVRAAYTGLIGDLAFVDTQGESDPSYAGLGSRFLLVYLDAAEVVALQSS